MVLAIRHGITSNSKKYKCEKTKNETYTLSSINVKLLFIFYRV